MRTLAINKKTINLCKIDTSGEIPVYERPIELKVNYAFTKGETTVEKPGIISEVYITITTDVATGELFSPLDKVYVLVEAPMVHDILCEEADFQVKDILPSINNYVVYLERLQNG